MRRAVLCGLLGVAIFGAIQFAVNFWDRIPIGDAVGVLDGRKDVIVKWEQHADSELIAFGSARLPRRLNSNSRLRLKLEKATGRFANFVRISCIGSDGERLFTKGIELETKEKAPNVGFGEMIDPYKLASRIRPVVSLDEDMNRYHVVDIANDLCMEGEVEHLSATKKYIIDELNSFTCSLDFKMTREQLVASYSIQPEIQDNTGNVFGMAINMEGRVRSVDWVGNNPDYGYWNYDGGIKDCRSILLELWEGILEIDNEGSFCMADNGEIIIMGSGDSPLKGEFTIAMK